MFILCLFVVSFVGILIAVVFMEISYLARFRMGVSHPCSLIDYSRLYIRDFCMAFESFPSSYFDRTV